MCFTVSLQSYILAYLLHIQGKCSCIPNLKQIIKWIRCLFNFNVMRIFFANVPLKQTIKVQYTQTNLIFFYDVPIDFCALVHRLDSLFSTASKRPSVPSVFQSLKFCSLNSIEKTHWRRDGIGERKQHSQVISQVSCFSITFLVLFGGGGSVREKRSW